WLPAPPVRRSLVALALAVVIVSLPLAWYKSIGAIEAIRDWRRDYAVLINKSDFGILRYIHFLALAYLAWVFVGPGAALRRSGWQGQLITLISRVGQQSLAVFATSMVLARVFGAVLGRAGYGPVATLLVNLGGFATIIAVAWIAAFFKRRPWKSTRAPTEQVRPSDTTAPLTKVQA
ncbi:MAG: OpgC domain-containing protein, partial [Paracoccaceae bacterium]